MQPSSLRILCQLATIAATLVVPTISTIAVAAPAPCVTCGVPVAYESFSAETYNLTQYEGAFVQLLLPASWIGGAGLTESERVELLDRADFVYSMLKEVVGKEPNGSGKLRIAVVAFPGCGAGAGGCGYTGSKGVEIRESLLPQIREGLDTNSLSGFIAHEMMHNFDVYRSVLFLPEPQPSVHAWTDFIQHALNSYSRMGSVRRSPDRELAWRIEHNYRPYFENPALDWQLCVEQAACPINADMVWSGVTMRFVQLHGASGLRGFLSEVGRRADTNPPGASLQGRADAHFEAMALAVGMDLGCYADEWRWSVSQPVRDKMALLNPNPFCVDNDLDGWSEIEGDCDDENVGASPIGVESVDGQDNDCDGVVDNLLAIESAGSDFPVDHPISVPGSVEGEIPAGDEDLFTFQIFDVGSDLRFQICSQSIGGFEGRIWVYRPSNYNAHARTINVVSPRICAEEEIALDEVGIWKVRVGAPVVAGAYRATLEVIPEHPRPAWGSVVPPTITDCHVELGTATTSLEDVVGPAETARFWVSGVGYVRESPFGGEADGDWYIGSDGAGAYRVRAQLFSQEGGASDWSGATDFTFSPPGDTCQLMDADGDGLEDGVETDSGVFVDSSDTGSSPTDRDSDRDRTEDGLEVALGTDPNDPASSPDGPFSIPGIVAERGNSDFIPENTLAAIQYSVGRASHVLLDVRTTQDGVPVLMADATVDRTTNSTGTVSSMTAAQVLGLDAGSWYSAAFSTETVPTLDSAISTCINAGIVPVLLVHDADPSTVASAIAGIEAEALVFSGDPGFVAALSALNSSISIGYLEGAPLDPLTVSAVQATGASILIADEGQVFSEVIVERVNDVGLSLYVTGVEGAAETSWFVESGVDAVSTPGPLAMSHLIEEPMRNDFGLIAYWPFDEESGIDVNELVIGADGGFRWNATPPVRLPGPGPTFGNAISLAPTDDFVEIENSAVLSSPNSNAISLSVWVKLDHLPSQLGPNGNAFSGIFDSIEDGFILYLDWFAGELRFKVTDADGTAARPGIPDAMLDTEDWHFVTAVYDGDAGEARIYLDSVLVDVELNSSLTSVVRGQAAAIGTNGPGDDFDGSLDDFAIFDRPLTQAEIDMLWNGGQGRTVGSVFPVPEPGFSVGLVVGLLGLLASARLAKAR